MQSSCIVNCRDTLDSKNDRGQDLACVCTLYSLRNGKISAVSAHIARLTYTSMAISHAVFIGSSCYIDDATPVVKKPFHGRTTGCSAMSGCTATICRQDPLLSDGYHPWSLVRRFVDQEDHQTYLGWLVVLEKWCMKTALGEPDAWRNPVQPQSSSTEHVPGHHFYVTCGRFHLNLSQHEICGD